MNIFIYLNLIICTIFTNLLQNTIIEFKQSMQLLPVCFLIFSQKVQLINLSHYLLYKILQLVFDKVGVLFALFQLLQIIENISVYGFNKSDVLIS